MLSVSWRISVTMNSSSLYVIRRHDNGCCVMYNIMPVEPDSPVSTQFRLLDRLPLDITRPFEEITSVRRINLFSQPFGSAFIVARPHGTATGSEKHALSDIPRDDAPRANEESLSFIWPRLVHRVLLGWFSMHVASWRLDGCEEL